MAFATTTIESTATICINTNPVDIDPSLLGVQYAWQFSQCVATTTQIGFYQVIGTSTNALYIQNTPSSSLYIINNLSAATSTQSPTSTMLTNATQKCLSYTTASGTVQECYYPKDIFVSLGIEAAISAAVIIIAIILLRRKFF